MKQEIQSVSRRTALRYGAVALGGAALGGFVTRSTLCGDDPPYLVGIAVDNLDGDPHTFHVRLERDGEDPPELSRRNTITPESADSRWWIPYAEGVRVDRYEYRLRIDGGEWRTLSPTNETSGADCVAWVVEADGEGYLKTHLSPQPCQ